MAARRRKKNNILRIIGVLCGCLGAGWLFSRGWQEIIELCIGYKSGTNIFSHFFSLSLFSLATLITALLFFVVSIRDLGVMKDGVSVASIVINVVVCIIFGIYFVNTLQAGLDCLSGFWFWYNVLRFVMLIAYIMYALYCLRGGKTSAAWTVALIASIGLIGVTVFGYVTEAVNVSALIYIIISSFAHMGVFYCGLRQY